MNEIYGYLQPDYKRASQKKHYSEQKCYKFLFA